MFKKKSKSRQNAATNSQPGILRFVKSDKTHFITGLIIVIVSIAIAVSVISFLYTGGADQSKVEGLSFFHSGEKITGIKNLMGLRGAILSNILISGTFGISSLFMLAFLICTGLWLMNVKTVNLLKCFIINAALTVWTSLAFSYFFSGLFNETAIYIGGKHGLALSDMLCGNFGSLGTFLFILLTFIIIMVFITSRTILFVQRLFRYKFKVRFPERKKDEKPDKKPVIPTPQVTEPEPEVVIVGEPEDDEKYPDLVIPSIPPVTPSKPAPPNDSDEKDAEDLLAELGPFDPKADLSHYQSPTLDLLKTYEQNISPEEIREEYENNKSRIIQTLKHFDIEIKSIKATVGPTVTLYEIVLADGIRINKVRNLEDDIAMSLSALGIRIIAPMPGKGTIGIEVPNSDPQIVSMHSILASKKFQETKFELPVALGRTITNEVFMVDLTKMPHLLVAGATGQGKSVGLNAAITSLLYRKHPAELKFVLIDPKMVEFSLYSVIEKHFLAKLPDAEKPIITDFTKVIYTLNSLCIEMDDRYKLLEKAGSRNVQEYNVKFINRRLNPMKGHRFMPYIVVIIDEFGDLIMTAGKEIEQPIARIAQKARAVGIHMIIATQRPTTNIITGTIKANFPARIAFRVITAIDSRTILDSTGANQLIGRGDMLFFTGNDKTRIQCAFVDTPEVERIVKFIGNQQGYPEALILPEYSGDGNGDDSTNEQVSLDKLDPLFKEAAQLIVDNQQGSTSLIQRKISIGFARAGRLMDQLELAGIVGPTQGNKPREVLITDRVSLEQKLHNLGISVS
ncbi:MAG: DNA translocase FtsK [Dysgonamonadaceae bacterium]|jgi:S-DNA-T family DNA segregation ATPase FtsK/SpoIIIE|nr:DNA translocase FtsK [Dysgonamonadaceae bacterium]